MTAELVLIFILGLCVGSFLNVYIDRSVRLEGVIFGKSHCDSCSKNIAWYDLIPIVSYIALRAKCRFCKSHLSLYYPAVELSTGVLFVYIFIFATAANLGFLSLFYLFVMTASLVAIFFIDLKYGIIPDKIVLAATAFSLAYLTLSNMQILPYLLSAIGSFAFFLLLLVLTRGKGMGWGDVKYAILMGLILGFPKIIVALYLTFLTGAIAGVILILWRKKKLRGSTIPFGPFLVTGTILSLFHSEFFLDLLMFGLF